MGLFGRKATTVGLDIGSGLIKLVAISHTSGGPVLTKVAFTPIGNDAIVEGEIMDPGIVAEAIKGLMASAGIKTKSVVTAVGGRDVIVKKITMDRMQEAEAREVIRWEAEQHVPFDMDNVELDFQILDPEGEGLQMTVLLVAAKRELVDHKLALLADVGLHAHHHRRGCLRAPQRIRDQLSRGHERRGGPGQHRPREHQHLHPGRRRSGAHPGHPGGHAPVPRGPAAGAGTVGRGSGAHAAGRREW